MYARLLHGNSSSNPRIDPTITTKRAFAAATVNIAFRPWSGDLILTNSRLAKPIPQIFGLFQGGF